MSFTKIVSLLFIGFLALSFTSSPSTNSEWQLDWKLKKNSQGIKVYTSSKGTSKYDAFKAVTRVNAPQETVLAQLRNASSYTQWLDKCSENRVTKRITDKSYYVYTVINFPAFSSDRALHSRVDIEEKSSGVVIINLNHASAGEVGSVSNTCDSCINMPHFDGNWIVTPIDANTTEIIYHAHAEPGGSMPAWLVDMFLVKSPHTTLKNFRKLVEN